MITDPDDWNDPVSVYTPVKVFPEPSISSVQDAPGSVQDAPERISTIHDPLSITTGAVVSLVGRALIFTILDACVVFPPTSVAVYITVHVHAFDISSPPVSVVTTQPLSLHVAPRSV